MKTSLILTYSFLVILSITIYYISWLVWILEFILSISLYIIIFFIFHLLISKIRKKSAMYFLDFIKYFLQRVSVFLIVIITTFSWVTYLLNEKYPASMPEYTITNGDKVVTFQAMSHIWTVDFYNKIKQNIIEHKKNWWVYFFEGVKPWTKESQEKFNKAIWVTFDKDLYKNFSKLYWVTYQNNNDFLWHINNLDFNVDLNMDEIVKFYEKKINSPSFSWTTFTSKIPIDANKAIINTLLWLNEKELKILVYINQAILNFIIWNDTTQTFLTNNFANKELFEVILDKRDGVLANALLESEYNDIYVTYWLLHFKWVLKILQENDPKWKIVDTQNLYPIK